MPVNAAALAKPYEIEKGLPDGPGLFSNETNWPGFQLHVHVSKPPVKELEVPPCTHHSLVLVCNPIDNVVQMREGRVHKAKFHGGELVLTPAGMPCVWRWDAWASVIHLYLSPQMMPKALLRPMRDPNRVALKGNFGFRDSLVERLLLALKIELESDMLGGRIYGESLGAALACHLLRHYSVSAEAPSEYRERLSGHRLRQALDYIEQKLGEDLSLAELALVADLSPYHFARAFKQSVGVAPHQYVLAKKVDRAKDLLTRPRMTVAEISQALGFSDQSHFTRVFRRFTGTAPKQYAAQR
jgi:AraC family transcriptional regulator